MSWASASRLSSAAATHHRIVKMLLGFASAAVCCQLTLPPNPSSKKIQNCGQVHGPDSDCLTSRVQGHPQQPLGDALQRAHPEHVAEPRVHQPQQHPVHSYIGVGRDQDAGRQAACLLLPDAAASRLRVQAAQEQQQQECVGCNRGFQTGVLLQVFSDPIWYPNCSMVISCVSCLLVPDASTQARSALGSCMLTTAAIVT